MYIPLSGLYNPTWDIVALKYGVNLYTLCVTS